MQSVAESSLASTLPTPTVFVVDDDVEVRTSLNQLLRSARLNAKTYSSAFEFLEDYKSPVPGCLVLRASVTFFRVMSRDGLVVQWFL